MAAKRALVTGAAGFIGGRLALALAADGWEVTALDLRDMADPVRRASRTFRADFRAPAVLEDVREGRFDAVVHQAAISNTLEMDSERLHDVNVIGALQLAAACQESSTTFVYASSFSVYGRARDRRPIAEDEVDVPGATSGPLNPYARSKLALDRAMQARTAGGLRWAGLRYTNVFAAGEPQAGRASSIISQIVGRAARAETIDLFADALTAARDYVPVDRVCAVVRGLLSATFPSATYNVGAGLATTFATLLEWCAAFDKGSAIKVRLVRNPIPDRYQYWTCADLGRISAALGGIEALEAAAIRSEAERLFNCSRRG